MATVTFDATFVQTTDAEFRAWVAAVIAGLVASGLTQTADTGQINTATVTTPAGVSASQGYAMFRFNDAAHSACPVFIKFEFGSGSSNVRPNIYITVGTGTDGAGTVTGTVWGTRVALNTTTNATSVVRNYMCYNTDTGTFWMGLAPATGSTFCGFMGIFRGADESGAVDDEVVMRFIQTAVNTTGSWTGYRADLGSAITNPQGAWAYPLSTLSVPLGYAGRQPLFYAYCAGSRLRQLLGLYGCGSVDFASGTIMDIQPPGQTARTYYLLPAGGAGQPTGTDHAGSTTAKCFLIWE